MPKALAQLKRDLRNTANKGKAVLLARFFKTALGEYGEGDKFLGVMVPQSRALVKKYWQSASLADVKTLLESAWHEERLIALFILVEKFQKAAAAEKQKIYDFYLANTKHINNWDLVDLSAPKIVGAYLYGKDVSILYKLARSKNLWERRIAILATFYFIKEGEPKIALEIAGLLVNDSHDLIQKAVGWMLREIGKRCGQEIEEQFLRQHCQTMPRVALRYAIERFSEPERQKYLTM